MDLIRKLANKIFSRTPPLLIHRTDNPNLSNNGERVDVIHSDFIDFNTLDMYEKSHFRRYEYAVRKVKEGGIIGDFACGTGYGSVMLSEKACRVTGVDIDAKVVEAIKKRYLNRPNVSFLNSNLLHISYDQEFDDIVSFETVEHLEAMDIPKLFLIFFKALKPGGGLTFSVPYLQERSENAIKMGFHLTFNINEDKIDSWLAGAGFVREYFRYQSYDSHDVYDSLEKKDFIICGARKN